MVPSDSMKDNSNGVGIHVKSANGHLGPMSDVHDIIGNGDLTSTSEGQPRRISVICILRESLGQHRTTTQNRDHS